METVGRIFNCKTVRDAWDRPVLLFKNDWNLNQLQEDHPELELRAVAPVPRALCHDRGTACSTGGGLARGRRGGGEAGGAGVVEGAS